MLKGFKKFSLSGVQLIIRTEMIYKGRLLVMFSYAAFFLSWEAQNLVKFFQKPQTKIIEIIERLVQTYKLKENCEKGAPPETLTLARIGTAFPFILCDLANTYNELELSDYPGLPGCFFVQALASLIPQDMKDLIDFHLKIQVTISKEIYKNFNVSQIPVFHGNAVNCILFNNEMRLSALKKLGIIDDNDQLVEEVKRFLNPKYGN